MRGTFLVFCLLVNLSVLLMPFNTTHAHVGHGEQPAQIHDGHRHGLAHVHEVDIEHAHDHGVEQESAGATTAGPDSGDAQVIELNAVVANASSPSGITWDQWLPLACVIAVLAIGVQSCLVILRPPRASARRPSHRTYWRPPLRGPPLSIPAA